MGLEAVVGKWLTKTLIGKLITSYAINSITNKLFGGKQKSASPTYGFGALQTQANNTLVMPLVYGKVKMAGNDIWASPEGTTQSRLIGFSFGTISGFEEIKLNDIVIGTLSNANYTAYLGDGVQLIDSRVTGATQEDKAKLVGGLKYDAYLAITATASDKLNGNYNVTAIVKGRLVRIYTDINTYTVAWSDNPAWCILDFLTHYNGCAIKYEDIDIQSFINFASYCDELVKGQKRFTLNIALDEKKSKQDWLDEMLVCCQGYKTYSNGKHGILIDKPEVVSQVFDITLDESLDIEFAEIDNVLEKVQITYLDPSYEWAKVGAVAKWSTFKNRSPISKTIEMFGVTNFNQASRLAWFYLNQMQTCRATYIYKTNKRAINRSVGDVVAINEPIRQLQGVKCRIVAISNNQDDTIVLTMKEYNENLYTDTMGSVAPTIYRTSLPNPAKTPPNVTNIVIDEPICYRNKDGTIISYFTGSCTLPNYGLFSNGIVEYTIDNGVTWNYNGLLTDNKFTINNVLTNKTYKVRIKIQNAMGITSTGTISSGVFITGIDKPPSDVATVSASIDPTNSKKINIEWDDIDDIDKKGFYLWINDVLITKNIIDTQYTYTATQSGTYIIKVKAVDNSNNLSANFAVTSITTKIEPADVTNFQATQLDTDRSILRFEFDANTETDFSNYILKYGDNYTTGTIIHNNLTSNIYDWKIPNAGFYKFFIKAKNNAGNESVNETVITKQLTLKPSAPATGTIKQDTTDKSILVINWDRVTENDIYKYVIYNEQGVELDRIADTTYRYKITKSGTYTFAIKTLNVAGYFSNALNLTIIAMIEPLDVTGFTAVQSIYDHSKVTLMWDVNNEASYFKIKKGLTWDNSVLVNPRVYGNSFDVKITDESEQIYWIKAVSVAGDESQYPAQVDGIYNLNPSAPTNLTIVQDINDRSILNISWDAIPELDILEYWLKWGNTWETGTTIINTKETKAIFKPPTSGDYKIMIKARNNSDFYSDEVFSHFYATLEPSNVENFQVFQNGSSVEGSWDISTDADVVSYRIVEGATYENGRLVSEGLTLTNFEVTVDTERTYFFHIKALNRSGKYSQLAKTAVVTVTNLPPKNYILTYDEIALQSGVATNVEFGTSLLNASNFGGKASDYPNLKASEVGGQTVLKLQPKSIITDPYFSSPTIDTNVWKHYSSGTYTLIKTVDGIKHTSTNATATYTGLIYDFPDVLERSTTYIIEFEARANKVISTSTGFITQTGGWATGNLVTSYQTTALTTSYQKFKLEFTINATASADPGKVMFGYFSMANGDWIELKYAKLYKKSGQSGSYYETTGEYSCIRKDVGQIITANISTLFYATNAFSLGGNAKLQYRTSRDNINWTNWTDFKPALCTFRYVDFKVVFVTVNNTVTPEVNTLKINIDVPDADKYGNAVIPVGGTTINYNNTYWTQPSVIAHAIGAGLHADIQTINNTSFVVKVLNNSNADVGGTITWFSKGY